MAALSKTDLTKRLTVGDRVMQSFRATSGTAGNATEWIATGLSDIDAVVGMVPTGTTAVSGSENTPAQATGTVTFTGVPTADDTVTIDGIVYTFKASPSAANEVDIGGDADTNGANLAKAINRTGTPGTEYGADTAAHPTVEASNSSGTVTITARDPGTVGNGVTLAESADNTTVSGANLTGGTDGAAQDVGWNIVKNAQGTGVAADTNLGDLGVEFTEASVVFEVTVIGRP